MAGTGAKVGSTVAVLVLGAAGIAYVLRQGGDPPGPEGAAEDYLAAWEESNTDAMAELVDQPPATFAPSHQAVIDGLGVTKATYQLGEVTTEGDAATAGFTATLSLAGLGDWSYEGQLRLDRTGEDDSWLVTWSPAAIHPRLQEGMSLGRTREVPQRASILDLTGEPLVQARDAVTVGVEPQRMRDRQVVKDALATNLGVDPATVDNKLDAPGVQPNHFVPIVTLPRAEYDQVKPVIYEVPGLVFRETTLRSGPWEGAARHVLGRTGEITAERLQELGGTYQVGDIVGLTGLEARFETQLAGTPSGDIQVEDQAGNVVEVLGHIAGTTPVPLATTLDPSIQAAVEEALAGVDKPAAVVVVDNQSNIRAAASLPLDDGFNRALGGTYPPGSTFKIVTASALLDAGLTPDSPVDCPETLNAGGRIFRNFEGEAFGPITFGEAFAESCNTAFVNATADMDAATIAAAAGRLGFNTEYSVGLTTEGGSYPDPTDATEKAASAIGQGRVTVSPLHMATVAGAVIDGTWDAPTLLPGVPQENRPASTQLAAGTRDALAGLMRRVVTEGTGTEADAPGTEVAGKTGTAEFGSGDPLPTHAWFVGFRGNLAVAIVIEGGGVGGRDAAPIAGQIFAALP